MIVRKTFALKMGALEESGERPGFSGVGVVFGDRDVYGDVIRPNAFAKSIADSGGSFPCLWCHSMSDVLGSVTVTADGRALNVKGSLLIDKVARAAEVYALMREKAVRGLSVGFLPLRRESAPDGNGSVFLEARLLEISLCPVPAFDSARVTEVRALGDTIRNLDAVENRGELLALRSVLDGILEGPEDEAVLKALRKFSARR